MNLEQIFGENMLALKQRIDIIGNKFPNLMKAFSFKKNDPHIERMISSFALISASLEYEVAKKMAKEIRSIFMNIFPDEFCTIPPAGIVQIRPSFKTHFKLEKGKILRDSGRIFKTKRPFFINDIQITNIEKTFHNNRLGLNITIEGNKMPAIEAIDLLVDLNTLNAIFHSETKITGILKNRDLYETNFSAILHEDFCLRDFCIFPNQFCFIRLIDLQIQKGAENQIEIFIPLKNNININHTVIQTNCVILENRFITQSAPFRLISGEETIIPIDSGLEVINIKKLVTRDGKIVPHVNENAKGWHLLIGKDNIGVYIDESFNDTVFTEIECFNTTFNTEAPFFEEYIPGTVSWYETPTEAYKYIYQNEVTKLIQLMYLDQNSIYNIFNTISELLSIYNCVLKVNFTNIEHLEIIKPIKISNYVVPKMCTLVSCTTDTTNFILLRHIVEEIRKKLHTKVDFLFNTPEGEALYES